MSTEAIIEYARRIRDLRRAGPSNLEQASGAGIPAPARIFAAADFVKRASSSSPNSPRQALAGRTSPSSAPVSRRAPLSNSRRRQSRATLRAIAIPMTSSSSSASSHCRFGRFRIFRACASSGATIRSARSKLFRRRRSIRKRPTPSAERLIRRGDPAPLIAALTPLALADPPPASDAEQLAGNSGPCSAARAQHRRRPARRTRRSRSDGRALAGRPR